MDDVLPLVRAVLSGTPDRWLKLAETLPAELLGRQPAPREWSALECLVHLIDVEPIFFSRVQAFLAGQDFPAFNPDEQGSHPEPGQPLTQFAAEFAHLRSRSLKLLLQVTPDDFTRQVRHEELGPVRLVEMLNEWAAHDLMHTVQAERALMQPFIQACGPWLAYFMDHMVGE